MKYYKHSQLVKEYSVSDRTVRNWVEASLQGKVDLKLYEQKGRYYVANSVGNNAVLESLAQSGKKYRNSRSSKSVEVDDEFYETFSQSNVADIFNALDKHRELPWSYSYFGAAAKYWDEYLMELHSAGKGNLVTNTIEALKLNYAYLESLIADYDHVNVINICTGNNVAVHDLLSRIRSTGKLHRFIAADISNDMLDIAEQNIERWFSGSIKMERHIVDIRNQPISAFDDNPSIGNAKSINVFLMVSGPIVNFENPTRVLQTINAGMSKDDILVTTIKRDSPQVRQFFDFNVRSDNSLLGFRRQELLRLMSIDQNWYDVEQDYDDSIGGRYMGIKLKVNLTLHFKVYGSLKEVELEKGERIIMWRSHKMLDEDLGEALREAGFSQLLTAQTSDRQLLLTISQPTAVSA